MPRKPATSPPTKLTQRRKAKKRKATKKRRPNARRDKWQAPFLEALAKCGHVGNAAESAKVSREAVYKHRRTDPVFAEAFEAAAELGARGLEDEARRRSHDGVDEPVFYQGQQCGTVRRYSDSLLMFLLRARFPDVYRERRSVELTGQDGGPVQFRTIADLKALAAEAREAK